MTEARTFPIWSLSPDPYDTQKSHRCSLIWIFVGDTHWDQDHTGGYALSSQKEHC